MTKFAWMILPALIGISSVSVADPASDREITQQVRAVFREHPDVCAGVGARTKDGIVYLTGTTSTGLQKQNAVDLAKGVPGVKRVVDEVGIDK